MLIIVTFLPLIRPIVGDFEFIKPSKKIKL